MVSRISSVRHSLLFDKELHIDDYDIFPQVKYKGGVGHVNEISIKDQFDFVCQDVIPKKKAPGISFYKAKNLILRDIDSCDCGFLYSLKKLSQAENVAVILKGKSVVNRKVGFLIDSHDLVLRVNISDFSDEKVFGSKTSMLYHATFLKEKVKSEFAEENFEVEEVFPLNETDFVKNKQVSSIVKALSYESPTTGFSIIILALLLAKGHVTVFGFDSYSSSLRDWITTDIAKRNDVSKVRDLAAPSHEIDYEYWYVHNFLKEYIFPDKLILI